MLQKAKLKAVGPEDLDAKMGLKVKKKDKRSERKAEEIFYDESRKFFVELIETKVDRMKDYTEGI